MTDTAYKMVEVAYALPNPRAGYALGTWRRRYFDLPAQQRAFDRLVAKVKDAGGELRIREGQ